MILEPANWRKDAACADYPNALWFADRGGSKMSIAAGAICQRCPVRVECLAFAMADRAAFQHGTWAGTTPDDRKRLRRQQRAA